MRWRGGAALLLLALAACQPTAEQREVRAACIREADADPNVAVWLRLLAEGQDTALASYRSAWTLAYEGCARRRSG